MRKFNELEKQIVKGLQSAKWSWKEICDVIELIKYHIANNDRFISANIDSKELNMKSIGSHRYEIKRGV
jgi:hypothetical protein